MREVTETTTIYVARDGKRFIDRDECERHEKTMANIVFYVLEHTPDLTETGEFTKFTPVAVYSENGYHKEILERFAIDELSMNVLGESVNGHGYQPHFCIVGNHHNFAVDQWNNFVEGRKVFDGQIRELPRFGSKHFLSPVSIEGFPEPFNYMKEWSLQ